MRAFPCPSLVNNLGHQNLISYMRLYNCVTFSTRLLALLSLADQLFLFGDLATTVSAPARPLERRVRTWLVNDSPLSAFKMLLITTIPILCLESVVLRSRISVCLPPSRTTDSLGTHVRQQRHVVKLHQLGVDLGLVREHVQSYGPKLVALLQGLEERGFVDDAASGGVDEDRVGLHCGELGGGEGSGGLGVELWVRA